MSIFRITNRDKVYTNARTGIIATPHGDVATPTFLPIGTHGSVRAVTTEELKFWGAEIILANTYHLWQRPGDALIRKAGGLHKFMGWSGPILTDSGGFQVFSLGVRHGTRDNDTVGAGGPRVLSINDGGVRFRSELDGSEHFLSPEISVQIQTNLGSDIALVLDEFYPYTATKQETARAMARTFDWAKRAITEFQRTRHMAVNSGQVLFGIIQGGDHEDLRKLSAQQLRSLDFPGYAIGGVAVSSEPNEKMYIAVERTIPYLEEDKPRHLLGVGTPEQIIQSVARGIDTFDCVLPTRNARHGELYVNLKAGQTADGGGPEVHHSFSDGGYATLRITNAQYAEDFNPVDNTCKCYGCLNFTRAYMRHLFMAREPLGLRLATMHNLRFYLNLMEKIRNSIGLEQFSDLVQNYRERA